jgi:hypothetical protein
MDNGSKMHLYSAYQYLQEGILHAAERDIF